MESIELPIRQIDGAPRSRLSLEGTVLVFSQSGGWEESETLIPVEFITVSEAARFKARRLIHALLAMLLPLIGVAVVGLVTGAFDREREPSTALVVLCLAMVLGGFLAFCVLLVSCFFRVRTVRLTIAPSGGIIEFWKDRRRAGTIDALLREIRHRQGLVGTGPSCAIEEPVVFANEPSLRRRLAALFCWSAPMISLGVLPLLLIAIPIAWFLRHWIRSRGHPPEYQRAIRSCRVKNWNEAIQSLVELVCRRPDYVPAYILLLETYTRSGRFDEARDLAARLYSDSPDMIREVHTDIQRLQWISERRDGGVTSVGSRDSEPFEREICE